MNNRYLHAHLYENGKVGMNNIVMSMEIAVIIGMLTQRETILYAKHPMMLSSKLLIGDLFDVDGVTFRHHLLHAGGALLPERLMDTCITNGRQPSPEYLCGRNRIVDLRDYQDAAHLSTRDCKTYGFYSWLFCLTDEEKKRADMHVRNRIRPKQRYRTHAEDIVRELRSTFGGVNSIHVRRGDYLQYDHFKGSKIAAKDFLNMLLEYFPTEHALLIHTDEEDASYFNDIKLHFPNVVLIDKVLPKHYDDKAELGLVSQLIASQADHFAGTMYSTFSEMIRRYRKQQGRIEQSLYLYSQVPEIKLANGRILEDKPGENKWNRIRKSETWGVANCWWKDWYEHTDDAQAGISQ